MDDSEVGKQSEKENQALPSSQYSVLPTESTLQTPEKEKSTDGADKSDLHERNPSDDALQKDHPDFTEKGNKSDCSLWKLTRVGETWLLKTDEELVSLPTSVTPSDNPTLSFKEEEAFVVCREDVFEINKDRNGTLTFVKQLRVEDSQKEQKFEAKAEQNGDKQKHCYPLPENASDSFNKGSRETVSDDTTTGIVRTNETLKDMSSDADAKDKADRTLTDWDHSQDRSDRCPKIQFSEENKLAEDGLAVEYEGQVADIQREIDKIILMKRAETATSKDGIKDPDRGDSDNNVSIADSIQQLLEGQEFEVPSITASILHDEKTRQELNHKFPHVMCTCSYAGHRHVCKVEGVNIKECSAAREYILNLAENYGTVEIGFKDIRNLNKLKNYRHILEALLRSLSEEMSDMRYEIDIKKGKVIIFTDNKKLADTVADKIKKGIAVREEIVPRELDFTTYFSVRRKTISECGFSNEVEVDYDEACHKVKIAGLKKSVEAITEKLKPVTKTYVVHRTDKFDMIVDKCKKETDGKVEIVPMTHTHKQGILFRGPCTYVGEIMQYVETFEENIKTECVSRSIKGQSELKENNDGEERIDIVRQGSLVQHSDQSIYEEKTEGFEETEWILPTGQKIILTSNRFKCTSAELIVHLEEGGAEGLTGRLETGNENIFYMRVPVKDDGKDKHCFHDVVEDMLKITSDKNFGKMAVLLQEVGGWNFTAVVKHILYPVRKHLISSKQVSLSWTFCVPDRMQYNKAFQTMEDFLSVTEGDRKGAQKPSLQVSVVTGSLCDQEVDVLVSTTKANLDLRDGVLSASVLARAGSEIQTECDKYRYGNTAVEPWSIIRTSNYKLPCKCVLHGVIGKWNRSEDIKTMQDFLYRCLVKSNELQMTSVAFPALGTGKLGYPARDVASAIFEAARYYQNKVKCSWLNQIYIVIYPEDTRIWKEFKDVERFQKDSETRMVNIGGVYLQARSTDMNTVKADTVIYLWERVSFFSAISLGSPFSIFGQTAYREFSIGRRQEGFHTFRTGGGDLNTSNIIHACIPFYDTSEKLASALQEAFTFVGNKESEAIVIFFNTEHPILKYVSLVPRCLIDALRDVTITIPSLKSASLIIEGTEDFQNLQRHFNRCIEELMSTGDKQEDSRNNSENVVALHVRVDPMTKAKDITEKIESAQESKVKIEDNQADIQKSEQNKPDRYADSRAETCIEPPTEQKISEEIRGCHDPTTKEGEDEAAIDSKYTSRMMTERTNTDTQKSEESKTLPDFIMDMKKSDPEREGQTNEGAEWDSSLLEPDSEEWVCVEMQIPDVRDDENYGSLKQNIFVPPFPVAPPTLVYPFENRSKALLVCQNKEDASRLSDFKTEKFIYKRLKPPCLQMPQLTLSTEYCASLKDKGLFDRCKSRLNEMGSVEERSLQDEPYLVITAYSLVQIGIISGFLQSLEDPLAPSNMGNASIDSNKGFHDIHQVRDVNKIAWTLVNIYLSKELANFKTQNINISYDEGTIFIDGYTSEEDIARFKDTVQNLKDQQMEEIKPTKAFEPVSEYQKWCSEIEFTLGTSCCVYDQQKAVFIAFGKTYEDISKVKHQLGLKQGTIKQTGRRRNRNFDTSAIPGERNHTESISVQQKRARDFSWSVDAKEVRRYKTYEGIDVFVYVANILKLPVDCIVNAANDTLQHGGGVAQVIEKGAGWQLKQESENLVRTKGKVPVGMACTTTAGDLPYDCVIHAVGPRWYDFHPHALADVQDCERKLEAAITNSFLQAEGKGLKRIALPAISAAIFAVPEKMCAVQYARAVIKYSTKSTTAQEALKEIHFIDKNPSIVKLIQKTFQTMITDKRDTDYNVYDYVKIHPSTVYQKPHLEQKKEYMHMRPSRCFDTGDRNLVCIEGERIFEVYSENQKHQVQLYSGDILKVKNVDALVCTDDEYGNGKGGIAKALLEMARYSSYGMKKKQEFRNRKDVGDVVVTKGEGTDFKYVFYAILPSISRNRSEISKLVQPAYKNILVKANKRGINSVVCPLLGTGAHKLLSLEESATAFVSSFQEFGRQGSGKDKTLIIHLVCWTDSEKDRVAAVFKSFSPQEYTGGEDKTEELSKTVIHMEKHSRTDIEENCVICQDAITDPKTLPCLHTFCKGCIDNYLDNYKKVCPTCGKVCGIITGDQPEGTMTVNVASFLHCAGFEEYGRIEITYHFPGGKQKPEHPNQGAYYRGITRTAYLPDNKEGREILDLLKIAFERKLIFTIGNSRTTGKDDVITWNDIHHKTNPKPNSSFGYPDTEYFARVKDELAVKGVTVNDIAQLRGKMSMRGDETWI